MWESLVKSALLGLRTPGKLDLAAPSEFAELFRDRSLAPGNSAAELLDHAAAYTLYRRAGRQPLPGAAPVPVTEPDVRRECSRDAADLYQSLVDAEQWDLLREWIEEADRSGQRLPARFLPSLLNVAARQADLRQAAINILDARGRWLAQFNPAWQFAPTTIDEEAWEVGTKPERTAVLLRIRQSDPARARSMIEAVRGSDPAEERARWIELLRDGLSPEDEPFLEQCLDDRSARVREVAADLLARLIDSRFVARMIERAAACLAFTPGEAGSLLKLKSATKPRIEVTLPACFDTSMARDAIKSKPPSQQKIGERQFQLMQLLGAVPLSHWTGEFGLRPDDLIDAVPKEFDEVLFRGWTTSYTRHPDPAWTLPLVQTLPSQPWLLTQPDEFTALIRAVPSDQRADALRMILDTGKDFGRAAGYLLTAWRPLDAQTSAILVDALSADTLLANKAWRSAHPDVLNRLDAIFRTLPSTMQRELDRALTEIELRRAIHREFTDSSTGRSS